MYKLKAFSFPDKMRIDYISLLHEHVFPETPERKKNGEGNACTCKGICGDLEHFSSSLTKCNSLVPINCSVFQWIQSAADGQLLLTSTSDHLTSGPPVVSTTPSVCLDYNWRLQATSAISGASAEHLFICKSHWFVCL